MQKQKDLQKFQMMQMGYTPDSTLATSSVLSSAVKRKNMIGGPMNKEEIKLNKELLKKISRFKKQTRLSEAHHDLLADQQ